LLQRSAPLLILVLSVSTALSVFDYPYARAAPTDQLAAVPAVPKHTPVEPKRINDLSVAARNCAEALCEVPGVCEMCNHTPYCFREAQPATAATKSWCPLRQPIFAADLLRGHWNETRKSGVFSRRAQGRSRFPFFLEFGAEGALRTLMLSPVDAHRDVDGRYAFDGRILTLDYPHYTGTTLHERFEVLSITGDELHLRALPTPAPVRPPRIGASTMVGPWTLAHNADESVRWHRCNSETVNASCPLSLHPDGSARVYARVHRGDSPVFGACPGTWTFSKFNRLHVDVAASCAPYSQCDLPVEAVAGEFVSRNIYCTMF